ncbi:MAG: STAS domain-containing protein [Terriglobia bacterium]|jgi:anti-sigma B factor antagonist
MQLTIDHREVQGVRVLNLSGRIIAGPECDSVRSFIKEFLANHWSNILLDLANVTRIDSTGIGMLVESVIVTAKEGGQLKLVNVPRLIHNILSTHRLLQAFDIYATEKEAVASFTKTAPPSGH